LLLTVESSEIDNNNIFATVNGENKRCHKEDLQRLEGIKKIKVSGI
jgi:hypothetical protein